MALHYWRTDWSREVASTEDEVQGSPYAIQEYAVDSRIGDALSLLMLKERLGRAGLRLIDVARGQQLRALRSDVCKFGHEIVAELPLHAQVPMLRV